MPTFANGLLLVAGPIFGTITLAYGINAILRPQNALQPFELRYPALAADQKIVDTLMVIYGVRDIYVGLSIYVAAFYGNRKALGWMCVLLSGMAAADGVICQTMVGAGEWNHFGYAPVAFLVGLIGVFSQ